jgi:hypothetical protein
MTTKNQRNNKFNIKPKEQYIKSNNSFAVSDAGYIHKHPAFSYKYYDHNHSDFSFKSITDINDFYEMFERIKNMSGVTWYTIQTTPQMYHFHEINWSETSLKNKSIPHILQNYPLANLSYSKNVE